MVTERPRRNRFEACAPPRTIKHDKKQTLQKSDREFPEFDLKRVSRK